MSLDAKAHEEGMQDAFRDLEVLMIRAGEMVSLTASISNKKACNHTGVRCVCFYYPYCVPLSFSSLTRSAFPDPLL